MSATIFKRAVVTSAPAAILRADTVPLSVVLWAVKERVDGSDNSLILISTTETPENDWLGCPIPFDSALPAFRLEVGEHLFAIARAEGEICMMIQDAD